MLSSTALLGQIAEEMFEVLLKKDPNDLDTLYNYGRFLWKVSWLTASHVSHFGASCALHGSIERLPPTITNSFSSIQRIKLIMFGRAA
jgi:hypothetical protein